MNARRLPKLASTAVLAQLLGLGCAERHVQREVVAAGTPNHFEGTALVILPRTCIVHQPFFAHQGSTRAPGAPTIRKLRHAVDSMVAGARYTSLPVDTCTPSASLEPGHLTELRASDHVLRLMRARGAERVLVIQIDGTLVCHDASGSPLYIDRTLGTATTRERCDEDKLTLSAFVFRSDGTAVWAGAREIELGAPVESAIERLLRRVPVAVPLRSARSGTLDMRCRLDDRGITDCT